MRMLPGILKPLGIRVSMMGNTPLCVGNELGVQKYT